MEERIIAALDELGARGTWLAFTLMAVIAMSWIGVVVWVARLRSYHDEKGKNLATKEDVAELTRLAEQVRHEFESLREASSQQNRLQLAALDRRLAAHQTAFRVWHQLATAYGAADPGEAGKVDEEAVQTALSAWNDLWEGQSLYLDVYTRAAVHNLPKLHRDRRARVEEYRKSQRFSTRISSTPEERRQDLYSESVMLRIKLGTVDDDIRQVLALIEQGVHLPALRNETGGA